jgi:hypothetical protein
VEKGFFIAINVFDFLIAFIRDLRFFIRIGVGLLLAENYNLQLSATMRYLKGLSK